MTKVDKLESEANREPVVFTFDGVEYTVPNPKRWPLKVTRSREQGKFLETIESLLGPKQWKKFDPDEERVNDDLDELVVALFDAIDTDPKE